MLAKFCPHHFTAIVLDVHETLQEHSVKLKNI